MLFLTSVRILSVSNFLPFHNLIFSNTFRVRRMQSLIFSRLLTCRVRSEEPRKSRNHLPDFFDFSCKKSRRLRLFLPSAIFPLFTPNKYEYNRSSLDELVTGKSKGKYSHRYSVPRREISWDASLMVIGCLHVTFFGRRGSHDFARSDKRPW